MGKSDAFLRAAKYVFRQHEYTCLAIVLVGMDIHMDNYVGMFEHTLFDSDHAWWNCNPIMPWSPNVQERRVLSLLLAHEMHQTGDL